LFAKTTQISVIFAFPNFRKVDKFAASGERPKDKSVSASGGLRPPDPLPLDPAGGSAPDPHYRLVHSARHGAVPPPPQQKKILG